MVIFIFIQKPYLMKKLKTLLWGIIISALFVSCAELETVVNETINENFTDGQTDKLTEKEVIKGLKTSLRVGTDSAVTIASRKNGYLKNEAMKILLPDEAKVIYDYSKKLRLNKPLDNLVLSMNRSAEDAAKEAKPIFKEAITSLTIMQGWEILKGRNPAGNNNTEKFDSTAATNYLRSKTYDKLFDAFQPKIKNSLDKKFVGNETTLSLWKKVTNTYNGAATLLGEDKIETELDVYVTEKALNGLFYKVSLEEKEIRKDPYKWAKTRVGDILKKVFG
jgi:hypothetical protein